MLLSLRTLLAESAGFPASDSRILSSPSLSDTSTDFLGSECCSLAESIQLVLLIKALLRSEAEKEDRVN